MSTDPLLSSRCSIMHTHEVTLARSGFKHHRHLKGELVFCAPGGRLLAENECKWPLWRACKMAGLRKIGWHSLRHTFASHPVMRGVPLKTVQEFLGHSDIRTTMRYSHLSPDHKNEAIKVLDQPAPKTQSLVAVGN